MSSQYSLELPDDSSDLKDAWNRVLSRLKPEVPAAWFDRFVYPLRVTERIDSIVHVASPGTFVLEWVRERYAEQLQQMLSDELGEEVRIELRVQPQEKAAVQARAAASVQASPEDSRFKPNPKFSYQNYVQGDSNRLAYAGAKAVASEPGTKYNPLFIYGPSGMGKTHLLHAIALEILQANPKFPLVYVSAQQFAEEFVNALQNNRIDQFRRSQRSVGVWLVDDIQMIVGKDKTQEEVFHTFNHLQSLGKQIVLTSDRPPRDLYMMDERLRSRFEAGLVADVQMPDTETRGAILKMKAKMESIPLSHDVAMYLAENVPGNIRILEGALNKLFATASLTQEVPSMELAEKLVERYYRTGVLAKPSFNQILDAVGRHYKVSSEEIRGLSRKAPIVHARHVAVFVAREITKDSWKHIGTLLGDRDHTSMMHGYQKISEMMHHDRDLAATVKTLMQNLYPEG
jgi:chromosomal replication initiator protein